MTKFVADLKRGNGAQKLVMQLFDNCNLKSEQVDPKGPDRSFWDIITTGRKLSFTTEVKFDEYEARSGNIAIETFNPRLGKPSGIGITKAFFWAHVLVGGVVWLTPVEQLRLFLADNKPKRIIGAGGDGNATLHLYDSGIILPGCFTRIDNLTKRQLTKYIKDQCDAG
jgi:hypothetical protein